MSTPAALMQQKIRTTIPLSEAMEFSILRLERDEIQTIAPLGPNLNIHGTGFAGSVYSVAVLTGWALCMHIIASEQIAGDLVVARAEIRYRAPLTTDLSCRARVASDQRQAMLWGLSVDGKGKLVLDVDIGEDSNACLQATYIVIAAAAADSEPVRE